MSEAQDQINVETAAQAATGTQAGAGANGASQEEAAPQRPPLTDEHRAAIREAIDASGASAVFDEISTASNDIAMEHLSQGNRKGVLFAMALGQAAAAASSKVSKAESRMNKKKGQAADAEVDDDDEADEE